MIWVGKLGAASIAGVGVAGIVVMLVMSAKMGLVTGARAMVARFIGADDAESANHVARQGFAVSAVFAIVVAAVGLFLAEPILILMGVAADVVAQGAAYMRVMFVGAVAMSFRMMTEGIMQASGDTVTPMKITIFVRILHVALCPFLIFGWWIFPRLGVSGAALTNVVSQSLGGFLALWYLFSGRTKLRLTLKNFRVDLDIIWRMVKIGIPASVMGMERSFGNLVLMRFITPFGTLAVAAHTIVQRVEMLLYMPGVGLAQASGVLAGQNLGARQPERAERTGWVTAGLVEGIMVAGSVSILLWAESIVSIFSTEPGVVEITSTFLRIATAAYILQGFSIAFMMTISGVGDTLPPMLMTLLYMWGVQVPLAFFLPQITDLGVYGVRWAIVAGVVVGVLSYIIYFRLGRWKRKEV